MFFFWKGPELWFVCAQFRRLPPTGSGCTFRLKGYIHVGNTFSTICLLSATISHMGMMQQLQKSRGCSSKYLFSNME